MKITGKITAWSHSRWGDYEQCNYMAGLKHVMRQKTPGSPAMDRGSAIHTLAEKFTSSPKGSVPAELKPLAAEFRELRKQGGKAEYELAFDKDWNAALPYTVLIAPGGEVLYKVQGPIDSLELKRVIVKSLSEDRFK